MEQDEYKRKYLSISSISMLGACETKFMESIMGRKKVTKAMVAGKIAHKKVEDALPKISKEEIISEIKAQHPIKVREFTVFDEKAKICGRIDQINMTGFTDHGKNTGIIIDDKYPSSARWIQGLTPTYKLQLSSYAVALADAEPYSSICKIVGAQLRYMEKGTNALLQRFDMNSDLLDTCVSNTSMAITDAWNLYEQKKEPEHRRLDVEGGKWEECYCGR